MASAHITTETTFVSPLVNLSVGHRFRVLSEHQHRIVEYVEPIKVLYPYKVPFQLLKITDDLKREKFMDPKGWIFDARVLNWFIENRKLEKL